MFNNFEGFFNFEDMFNQKKQMDKCVMLQMSITTLFVSSSICLEKEISWVIAAAFFGYFSAVFLHAASSSESDEEQPADRKETESAAGNREQPADRQETESPTGNREQPVDRQETESPTSVVEFTPDFC